MLRKIFPLLLCCMASVCAADDVDIYIAAGQSNMDGRGLASRLAPNSPFLSTQANAIIWYSNPAEPGTFEASFSSNGWQPLRTGYSEPPGFRGPLPSDGFGPALSFVSAIRDATGSQNEIGIVKVAKGGTSIREGRGEWHGDPTDNPGYLHDELISEVNNAMLALAARGDRGIVRGMIWHQGESDRGFGSYTSNLQELIDSVRNSYGDDLPIVVGELSRDRTDNNTFNQNLNEFANASSSLGIVSSSGLVTISTDDTHFDTDSQIVLGQRYASALGSLVGAIGGGGGGGSEQTLGNGPSTGGVLDGWNSNLVVNETDTYSNNSGSAQTISLDSFRFHAGSNASPVTPFAVRVNADNNFTVLAIGTTRTGYSVGFNSLAFSNAGSSVTLGAGETLAIGFLDANANGTGSTDAAISFINGGDEIWYTGSPGTGSGRVTVGQAPTRGPQLTTALRRNYQFAIDFSVTAGGGVGGGGSEQTLGNGPSTGDFRDTWNSNLVVNETDTYSNNSGSAQNISLDSFNFHAGSNASPVTPFVVRVNANNNFTVLAIGTTRTGYSVGFNSLAFSNAGSSVTLGAGETLAIGFLDANANGTGSTDAAITFNNGGDEIWYTGSPGTGSGRVTVGQAPARGPQLATNFRRDYQFAIDFSVTAGGGGGGSEQTLGNGPTAGDFRDTWNSNLVVNETDTYSNNSGSAQIISLNSFNFHAGGNASPVTPFVVRVNANNNFTVLAIGTTRTGYSVGSNSLAFSNAGSSVVLGAGETLAIGFLDANANGTGSTDAAITFNNGGDEIWYTGSPGTGSGRVTVGQAPTRGPQLATNFRRDYQFTVDFSVAPFSSIDALMFAVEWLELDR